MKLKTITCHHVYNAGASLQAYALARYLREQGHELEIIDYMPPYLTDEYRFWPVPNPRFSKNLLTKAIYLTAKLPQKLNFLPRKRRFDAFKAEYLPLTARSYRSCDDLRADCPQADTYIAGSDQIWNTVFQNGKDPSFYLDFAPAEKRRISYAASFGSLMVSDELLAFVTSKISALDCVSVREGATVDFLQAQGIASEHVCDPTFLLSKQCWQQLLPARRPGGERYLFLYDFDRNEALERIALTLAQRHGLKIYSLFPVDFCDKSFYHTGPLDFLNLIYHADFILTNSFHAIAFSVIFQKDFWAVKRKENINGRLTDFLKTLGLDARMVSSAAELSDEALDYTAAEPLVAAFVERSKDYLRRSIAYGH